jgi:hypothetical protein
MSRVEKEVIASTKVKTLPYWMLLEVTSLVAIAEDRVTEIPQS